MPKWTLDQLRSTKAGAAHLAGEGFVKPRVQEILVPVASVIVTPTSWTIPVAPVPAPRMTRRDKWLTPRRPAVQRYFDYRAVLLAAVGEIKVPDEMHLVFGFPMPESWSKKKKAAMDGKPHRQRPDRDNCDKAVMDALFEEDGGVWKGSQEKRWTHGPGFVRIQVVYHE